MRAEQTNKRIKTEHINITLFEEGLISSFIEQRSNPTEAEIQEKIKYIQSANFTNYHPSKNRSGTLCTSGRVDTEDETNIGTKTTLLLELASYGHAALLNAYIERCIGKSEDDKGLDKTALDDLFNHQSMNLNIPHDHYYDKHRQARCNPRSYNALMIAAVQGNTETFSMLLPHTNVYLRSKSNCESVLSLAAISHKPEIIKILHQSLFRKDNPTSWTALMNLRQISKGSATYIFPLEALLNQSFDLSDDAKECVKLLIYFGGMETISSDFYHKIVTFNSTNGRYLSIRYDYPALKFAKSAWIKTQTNLLNMLNNGYSFNFIDKIAGHSTDMLQCLPLELLAKTFDAVTLSKIFKLEDIRKYMPLSKMMTPGLQSLDTKYDDSIDTLSAELIAANISTEEEIEQIKPKVKEQAKRKSAFMPISSKDF